MSSREVLACADVRKEFRDADRRLEVLRGIELHVTSGETLAIVGASGSGKTTLLQILGGLDLPTAGHVRIAGRRIDELSETGRGLLRNEALGFVYQFHHLLPEFTALENVAMPLLIRRETPLAAGAAARAMLDRVGLAHRVAHRPSELSGGERQRVALARALVNRPRVLLLDEPLGALDLKLRKQMQLELKAIQHDIGITFVHVTHDQEEAMTMADRIAIMRAGKIEQLGTPTELYEQPRTAFVAGFLGISNLLPGTVTGPSAVRLDDGTEVRVAAEAIAGRTGRVAVGVRPEKIRLGHGEENRLTGRLLETAYIGVATQYVLQTKNGNVSIYVQNSEPGAQEQAPTEISWSPDSTFVVDHTEETE
jgi:spermidine/putrescine transport system ATP-binding protein